MRLSRFIHLFSQIFYPLIKYLNVLIAFLLKQFSQSAQDATILSPSDVIRSMISLHGKDYVKGNALKNLEVIGNVLDITEINIDKIMTHRKDIFSINIDLSEEEIIRIASLIDYKNIPLWQDERDNFSYILNAERMDCDLKRSTYTNLKDYIEKPVFIPDITLVSIQLHNFKVSKKNFAIVIDEYGNAVGLVTLSDILEEIVGEAIYTHNNKDIKKLKDGSCIVNGRIPTRDLNRKMNFKFSTQHNQTFAGMIIDEIERIPEEGEVFNMHGCQLEILRKRSNRLIYIKIFAMQS